MAFYDLKPIRVFDEDTGNTYIIGDTMAVYSFGTDRPIVYSWDMFERITDDRRSLVFTTKNAEYKIAKTCFVFREDYYRTLAIVESMKRRYDFDYRHHARILPVKNEYIEMDIDKDAYVGEAMIDENDTAAAFVMMMNIKLVKYLWIIALFIMLVVFGALHLIFGVTRDNVLYFIPIAVAVGGIITLVVYLICHAMARNKFQKLAGGDPAVQEPITFAVSRLGFCACETCVYDGQELIPWKYFDFFVETDKMYIFYKDGNGVVYMPKKAFEKKKLESIADIIALHVEQK